MMKTSRKLLALLLSVLMLLTVAPLAFAADYYALNNGVLTITGAMPAFASPSTVPWYADRASVKTIIVSDNVTAISDHAFYGCVNAESVSLPAGITSIGASAFENCASLTSIDIPANVTALSDHLLSGCAKLTSVTLPDSLTAIGAYAFKDCTSLAAITIPQTVETVGNYAFCNCKALTALALPEETLTLLPAGLLSGCTALQSFTIPETVETIEIYAFQNCASLTEIVLPKAVATVGRSAFANCTNLTTITIKNNNISIDGYGTFPPASETHPVTIRACNKSNGEAHAIVNGYNFESIENEDDPYVAPQTDGEVWQKLIDHSSFFSKLFARLRMILQTFLKLVGLEKFPDPKPYY